MASNRIVSLTSFPKSIPLAITDKFSCIRHGYILEEGIFYPDMTSVQEKHFIKTWLWPKVDSISWSIETLGQTKLTVSWKNRQMCIKELFKRNSCRCKDDLRLGRTRSKVSRENWCHLLCQSIVRPRLIPT